MLAYQSAALAVAFAFTAGVACSADSQKAKGAKKNDVGNDSDTKNRDASMTTKTDDDSGGDKCASARKAIENKDFVGWRGLPDCSGAELFDGFPADVDERPKRRLGASFSSARFVLLEVPGYYRPMANVRDGKLVLVDGMNPEIGDKLKPLLDDLGEPEAKLDWVFGTLPFSEREWVYPERGITLFLNTEHDKALHIALYAATDLETYKKSLRPPLEKKRLPKK